MTACFVPDTLLAALHGLGLVLKLHPPPWVADAIYIRDKEKSQQQKVSRAISLTRATASYE